MLKKYLKVKEPDTIKVESTREEWVFLCVVTIMWEEIVLRLDKDWFFRNQQSQDDNINDTIKIEEEKARRRPASVEWDPIVIPNEEKHDFKMYQYNLRAETMKRIEYIVDWVDKDSLFSRVSKLDLKSFEDEVIDPVDEVVSNEQ